MYGRQFVHFKHDDFGIFDSLIQAYSKCPIDLKLGMLIPDTVR